MYRRLALATLLQAATLTAANPAVDPAGRYGFDWHKPDGARCLLVDAALKKKLGPCTKPDTPSFTGAEDHLACGIGTGEFLAFPTRERCQEELETMQANAP